MELEVQEVGGNTCEGSQEKGVRVDEESPDPDAGLTVLQEERKKGEKGRENRCLQCSPEKVSTRLMGSKKRSYISLKVHEWPSLNTSAVLSHWLRGALAKYGLGMNVMVEPVGVATGSSQLTVQVLSSRLISKVQCHGCCSGGGTH